MITGRSGLVLETLILEEITEHPGTVVVPMGHDPGESRAMFFYPRRWRWLTCRLGPKRRVVVHVSYAGQVTRHRA